MAYQSISAAATCPCDIYAAGGTPCVAAHSTVRALYGSYNGPLYQVTRKSDNKTKDIGVLNPGGFVNSAAQDSFFRHAGHIYDYLRPVGKGNHLILAPSGQLAHPPDCGKRNRLSIMVYGHAVYALYIICRAVGYRNRITTYRDWQPAISPRVCTWCAAARTITVVLLRLRKRGDEQYLMTATPPWRLSISETAPSGAMVPATVPGSWRTLKTDSLPEEPGSSPLTRSIADDYVTGMVKGSTRTNFAIKGGNADSGGLKTMYDGTRPSGYNPMKKQGAIILGIGGDNTHTDCGNLFRRGHFIRLSLGHDRKCRSGQYRRRRVWDSTTMTRYDANDTAPGSPVQGPLQFVKWPTWSSATPCRTPGA